MPLDDCCANSAINDIHTIAAFIGNSVTESTGCGYTDCPWIIQAKKGQHLNISLYDFGTYNFGNMTINFTGTYDKGHQIFVCISARLSVPYSFKTLGLLLTKLQDIVLPNLVKSRRREIVWYNGCIALKLDRHLGRSVVEMPVKFQSHWKVYTWNLRHRDLTRSRGNAPYRLMKRDPGEIISSSNRSNFGNMLDIFQCPLFIDLVRSEREYFAIQKYISRQTLIFMNFNLNKIL